MPFLDDMRRELIESGQATSDLLDYLDDRIKQIVSDKISQALADFQESLDERQVRAKQ